MANIVGCEVVSMESYYKAEEVKDSNYDEFSTLDLPLLLKNIEDIRAQSPTMIPVFDFVKNKRSGSKELAVSEDCGVIVAIHGR
jgi:uridine kinase